MQISCVKVSKKSVYKYFKNLCSFAVQKANIVYKKRSEKLFTRVLISFSQKFFTFIESKSHLLMTSFTHFPQTSTNTTINL